MTKKNQEQIPHRKMKDNIMSSIQPTSAGGQDLPQGDQQVDQTRAATQTRSTRNGMQEHDNTREQGQTAEREQDQVRKIGEDGGYTRVRTLLVSGLCAPGAGLVASLAAVVVMGILRLWAGIPTPVELFGDFVLKHIDVHTFIHLLQTYAPNPKTTPLGLALLGMMGAGVALSFVYAALVGLKLPLGERQIHPYRPQRREWLVVTGLMVGMTLVAVILFWNEIRQNFLGLPVGWASLVTAI